MKPLIVTLPSILEVRNQIRIKSWYVIAIAIFYVIAIPSYSQAVRFEGSATATWDIKASPPKIIFLQGQNTDSAYASYNPISKTLVFKAITKKGIKPAKNRIVLSVSEFNGNIGVFPIKSASCFDLGFTCSDQYNDVGNIEITKFDTLKKVISGTFDFVNTCYDDILNQSFDINVKNGNFEIQGEKYFKILEPTANEHAVLQGLTWLEWDINQIRKSEDEKIRKGVAADGTSRVYIEGQYDESVKFQLIGDKNGSLISLANQNISNNTTIDVEPVLANDGKKYIAFIYVVPDGIGNIDADHRNIEITAAKKSDGTLIENIQIQLYKPPVVLVHGMWSDAEAWNVPECNFKQRLRDYGFYPYTADYSYDNACSFDPTLGYQSSGIREVRTAVLKAIDSYRYKKIAVCKVDVIGHSLGGLLARSFIQQPTGYKSVENYQSGYIRRLVTIGTPHHGSPFGPLLTNSSDTLKSLLSLLGKRIGFCHTDFEYGRDINNNIYKSKALTNLEETKIKSHLVVCSASITTYDSWSLHNWEPIILGNFLHKSYLQLFGNEWNNHDFIVPMSSQTDGIPIDPVIPLYVKKFNDVGHSSPPAAKLKAETSNQLIQEWVIKVLNSDLSEGYFTPSLPKPSIKPSDYSYTNHSPSYNKVEKNKYSLQGSESIKISKPTLNEPVISSLGDSISFEIEPSGGTIPKNTLFIIEGGNYIYTPSDSFGLSVKVPVDKSYPIGDVKVYAFSEDQNSVALIDSTIIKVKTLDTVLALMAESEDITLFGTSAKRQIFIKGACHEYQNYPNISYHDLTKSSSGTTYQTKKGANVIKVSTDGLVEAVTKGTDTVKVSYNGLSILIPVTVIDEPNSIKEDNDKGNSTVVKTVDVKIFPNPCSENINFSYTINHESKTRLSIYDILGNKISVISQEFQHPGDYFYTFDCKQLNQGMYYLELSMDNVIQTECFEIIR